MKRISFQERYSVGELVEMPNYTVDQLPSIVFDWPDGDTMSV